MTCKQGNMKEEPYRSIAGESEVKIVGRERTKW